MNDRVNAFAGLNDPPVFATKPKPEKPVAPEALAEIAERNNFTSRQAPKPVKGVVGARAACCDGWRAELGAG